MADRRIYNDGGSGGVCGGSGLILTFPIQDQRRSSSEPLDGFFLSGSSTHGSSSMVSFDNSHLGKRSNTLFFGSIDQENNEDEDFDEYFNHPEKKRRLTSDQVRFLEKSFDLDNRLEPDRKIQLAKDLNLQPRQVAIWFQNRRARWKSKQLEKDYDVLQARFDRLKENYDSLLKEKESLRAEVHLLTDKINLKETGSSQSSNTFEASQAPTQHHTTESISESHIHENHNLHGTDIFEPESPHYNNRDFRSSCVFEHDYHSDITHEEEDNLSMSLLPLPPLFISPKLEDEDIHHSPADSCEDHAIWSWCF